MTKNRCATLARLAKRNMALLFAVSTLTSQAGAGETRDNPFLTTPTTSEESRIDERNRVISAVHDIMPELDQHFREALAKDRDAALAEIRKSAEDKAEADRKNFSGKLPAGARFLYCVQGKALYRDTQQNSNFFYRPPAGAENPCS